MQSCSSSLLLSDDLSSSSYCYYPDSIEGQGFDYCFSSDEDNPAKCEGSNDTKNDTFADTFIEPGQVPSFDHAQSRKQAWEGLLDIDNSADSQSTIYQAYTNTNKASKTIGTELVNLLIACAEAVSSKTPSLIHCLLGRLGELASPKGQTSMERVAAYFTEGLALRVTNEHPDVYRSLPLETDPSPSSACSSEAEEESIAAFHILNHATPLVKFAHFSANDCILQAFKGRDKVHVIDLDVSQGLQWPALFQGLASRPEGKPGLVRITGIGPFKDSVEETGDRLEEFAKSLGIPFEFHAVVERLEDIRLWMLHVKEGEAVAVNCIGQLHRSSSIGGVMELIKSVKPVVVTLVEQEAVHNVGDFEARFARSLRYYAAVFDSLDSCCEPARSKVERTIFAREIRNIVGCDGEERIERHEAFYKWKEVLEECGFTNFAMSDRAVVQAKLLLQMFSSKEYRIQEIISGQTCEGITLFWLDQPLLTASAWTL